MISALNQTAQAVIVYDPDGRRQIHVDLKDIQNHNYPVEQFEQAMAVSELLVLCNVNFSRPLLKIGQKAGKKIATDVHTVSDLEDTI